MKQTWTFRYYAWFGPCDLSGDIEYEAEVTEEEAAFLRQLEDCPDRNAAPFRELLRENEDLIDALSHRVGMEIEEYEGVCCTVEAEEEEEEEQVFRCACEDDEEPEEEEDEWAEEENVPEDEGDTVELRIRWPWE